MVLHPEKEAEARAVFRKWELDFATVGHTTDDLRFRVKWQGHEVANLPIKDLGDQAPEYDRPWVPSPTPAPLAPDDVPQMDVADALLALIGGHHGSSRRWVYEQYDTLIQGNSLQRPGGDAGVIRVEGHPTKALAFTSDVNPRYCEADPFEGGKQAVAEAWRNLTATGADPIAATDNLNFGNPERPEIMGQFVHCLRGIGDAARALDFPIVSGNVSLYNETQGAGILPTPAIGGVGVIADVAKASRTGFGAAGEAIVLIGATQGWLGQSVYLRDLLGHAEGAPPPVDLAAERRNGEFVRELVLAGTARAAHDLSDGGLAVALAEMCLSGGLGARIVRLPKGLARAVLFGEDQARYLVSVAFAELDALVASAEARGVPATPIGITGGDALILPGEAPILLRSLHEAHETPLPAYMAGEERAFMVRN